MEGNHQPLQQKCRATGTTKSRAPFITEEDISDVCGIVGYIGNKNACEVILTGLKRLEYRGYDSAGIAVHHDGAFKIVKTVGKVADFEKLIGPDKLEGHIGIGHTRWATHGGVTVANAHPQTDEHNTLVLVHNGIIADNLGNAVCIIKMINIIFGMRLHDVGTLTAEISA